MKKKHINNILSIIAIGFVIKYLYNNLFDFNFKNIDFNKGYFILSIPMGIIFTFNLSLLHSLLNRLNGIKINFLESMNVYFSSLLESYIPGKIFIAVKRTSIKNYNAETEDIVLVYYLETFCSIIGSMIFVLFSMLFWRNTEIIENQNTLIFIPLMLLFLVVHPKFINTIILTSNKLFKKQIGKIKFNFYSIITCVLLYTLNWFFLSAGLLFLFKAFLFNVEVNFFEIGGISCFSGIIGIIAIFTPGGLGVREGVIIIILSNFISLEFASIFAIVSRLWTTFISEITSLLVFKSLYKYFILLKSRLEIK